MSRRIRSIKPELLEDEKTAGLSDTAFRLFIGLITMADDFGRFRADARFVEKNIYWLAVPELGVATSLEELATTGMVAYYVVRGQRYGAFTNWSKHQRVDNVTGKKTGLLPGPEEADDGLPRLAATRGDSRQDVEPGISPPRLAAGSDRIGSDLDRSGAEGEPPAAAQDVGDDPRPSETRLKSAPPVAMPKSDSHQRFEAKLRSLPKLSDLDVLDLVDQCVGKLIAGAKVEWVLEALQDANDKSQRDELSHVRFQRAVSFIRHAKRPKQDAAAQGEAKGGSAYQDFTFAPGELGPAKQKRRVTAQDATVPSLPPVRDVAAMLAGLGTGPQRGAPVLTEAEREAKRKADVAAVLAMDDDKVAATGGER